MAKHHRRILFGILLVSTLWFILMVTYLNDLKSDHTHERLPGGPHKGGRLVGVVETPGENAFNLDLDPYSDEIVLQSKQWNSTPEANHEKLRQSLLNPAQSGNLQSKPARTSYNYVNSAYEEYLTNRTVILRQRPVTEDEYLDLQHGMKRHSFNVSASELVGLHRRIPSYAPNGCPSYTNKQLSSLPAVSVIICFHNEAWSTLLRTLHSVIDNSPPHLIKEIILVDDASTFEYLGWHLENYLSRQEKTNLVRTSKREGLVRTRLLGLSYATAEAVVFLDSHCECTSGWLPPLLVAIEQDPTKIVCPLVDVIDYSTFEYKPAKEELHGAFDWTLQFVWKELPDHEVKRRLSPKDNIRTPTIVGGLFAVKKETFKDIGLYDSAMNIWGAENIELSFRTWMCGGSLEIAPCSRVGHVFRTKIPYGFPSGGKRTIVNNSMRVAEVWLDDYKKYFYASQNIPRRRSIIDDIAPRLRLRRELKCKDFQWYLDNIIPEMPVPQKDDVYYGHIISKSISKRDRSKCLELRNATSFVIKCSAFKESQMFFLKTSEQLIHSFGDCLDVVRGNLVSKKCKISYSKWRLDETGHLEAHHNDGVLCLHGDGHVVTMERCVIDSDNQKWAFTHHFDQARLHSMLK